MTLTKEEYGKLKSALKQIDEFTHTIEIYKDFSVRDPWDRREWNFEIHRDCGKASICVENNSYSKSSLQYIINHDTLSFYTNELCFLIKNWAYIKGEIISESEKQKKEKEDINNRLTAFHI